MCTIISTTDCRDQNSEEKVKSECNEKTNCSIHASDNVFKDDCRVINTYLEVKFTCV